MSEQFFTGCDPACGARFPYSDLRLAEYMARPVAAMPLEARLEQARAIRSALNFLTTLLASHGETLECGEFAGEGRGLRAGLDKI